MQHDTVHSDDSSISARHVWGPCPWPDHRLLEHPQHCNCHCNPQGSSLKRPRNLISKDLPWWLYYRPLAHFYLLMCHSPRSNYRHGRVWGWRNRADRLHQSGCRLLHLHCLLRGNCAGVLDARQPLVETTLLPVGCDYHFISVLHWVTLHNYLHLHTHGWWEAISKLTKTL